MLRCFQLAPLVVKPICVHPFLVGRLSLLRNIFKSALHLVRNFYVRQWLDGHLRVIPGKRGKWSDKLNAKGVVRKLDVLALAKATPSHLADLVVLRSPTSSKAPWRLPGVAYSSGS